MKQMNQCIDRIIQIIRKNREEIRKHLAGLDEICIVSDSLSYEEMEDKAKELSEGKVSDALLFSLTDKGIRVMNDSNDIARELMKLVPKNVEKMIVSRGVFSLESKLSDFPKLREIVSTEHFNLKDNTFDEELEKVIRMDFPTTGKLGELFKNNFIVEYSHWDKPRLDMIIIRDRNWERDLFLGANVIDINLKNEKEIKYIRISDLGMEEVALFLEWLKGNDYSVDEVIIKVEAGTVNNLHLLEKYADYFNISIDYGEFLRASYDDFFWMRGAIDWYKELITSSDLSPFEQLIFAYDILKTFPYNESVKPEDSRNVPNIMKTGNIVCVGYSKLLEMIINELGIRSFSHIIMPQEDEVGHQRVLVRLDDSKYDIHGIFAVDPTWDSVAKELSIVEDLDGNYVIRRRREDGDRILREYDALTLYNYFLVSYSDYRKTFVGEKLPEIFRILEYYPYDDFAACRFELKKLFDNLDRTSIENYIFNSKKPSLEKFKKALSVVRRAEGYIEGEIDKNVADTIELNQMLDERNSFFKEDNVNKK